MGLNKGCFWSQPVFRICIDFMQICIQLFKCMEIWIRIHADSDPDPGNKLKNKRWLTVKGTLNEVFYLYFFSSNNSP
jgi:hypothetical protein